MDWLIDWLSDTGSVFLIHELLLSNWLEWVSVVFFVLFLTDFVYGWFFQRRRSAPLRRRSSFSSRGCFDHGMKSSTVVYNCTSVQKTVFRIWDRNKNRYLSSWMICFCRWIVFLFVNRSRPMASIRMKIGRRENIGSWRKSAIFSWNAAAKFSFRPLLWVAHRKSCSFSVCGFTRKDCV